jgi:hypothetical protein
MNPLVELNEVELADLGNERKESVYAYVFGCVDGYYDCDDGVL